MTLYCDPGVKFGSETPGGIRISHVSGIDGPRKVPIIITRGKSGLFTVQPIAVAPRPVAPSEADIAAATQDQLRDWWNAHPDLRPAIQARADALKQATETGGQ